jgi:hypothetical protein
LTVSPLGDRWKIGMQYSELLGWQWQNYGKYHASRSNLLLHIVTVPIFIFGNTSLLAALLNGSFYGSFLSVLLMMLSMAAQGVGHGREQQPAVPFDGPMDTVSRIFLEQWITFPRYVLSGRWYEALKLCSRNQQSVQ